MTYKCSIKFFKEKIDMELSEIIKTIRSELNLSQEGLARKLHVGFSSVNRWENNKSKPNQIARYALIELCKTRNLDQDLISLLEDMSQVR
jgi:transcriptional regulator, XRE